MSTQYNKIQGPYDYIRKKSIACIEHENVRSAVAPFIHNARVLELACGSGFYTYSLLRWGASSLLGVDISDIMLDEARRLGSSEPDSSATKSTDRVNFLLADCSVPTVYPQGPFDLVFGAWLLDNAPDRQGLVNMFRNVALNLEDGGHFVGVTPPPTEDPVKSINAEMKVRPPPEGSGGLYFWVHQDVADGVFHHIHGHTPLGDVGFDCYHLRKSVYEEAAREAGLVGELRWSVTEVPERFLRGDGEGGASMEELQTYESVANYGILVIKK